MDVIALFNTRKVHTICIQGVERVSSRTMTLDGESSTYVEIRSLLVFNSVYF